MGQATDATVPSTRGDRAELVEAALALFREQGLAAVTQRAVAERAGVPAPTLQHRFGTKDELLRGTFGRLSEAAVAAIEADRSALGDGFGLADSEQLFTALLGGPVLSSSDTPALLELLTQGVRGAVARPAVLYWTDHLIAFWRDAAAWSSEADDVGHLLAELQIGLALVSAGARRALESALANREVIAWIFQGPGNTAGPWFRRFLTQAAGQPASPVPAATPSPRGALHQRLLEAGAEIVAREGPAGLSFRAVADGAGASLSAVTHHFPRRDALIYAIYRHLHDALARQAGSGDRGTPTWGGRVEPSLDMVLNARIAGAPMFLASAELCLAAAREPAFAGMAWVMRMTRGLYQYRRQDPDFDPVGRVAFQSHVRSIWMTGCTLLHAARQGEDGLAPLLAERFGRGMALTETGLAGTAKSSRP